MTSGAVIPIPLAYNTLYAVPTSAGAVLIDAGPDYEGAWEALQERLRAHGLDPDGVRVVCLTHGHADHAGLGRRWQEAGASVVAGADDAFTLAQPEDGIHAYRRNLLLCLAAHGVPDAQLEGLRRHWRRSSDPRPDEDTPEVRRERTPRWPGPLRVTPFAPDRLIGEEDEVRLGEVALRAVPCPGHTPGTLVYLLEPEGIAFTGDHLLPGVTPAPGLQFIDNLADRRFHALPAFRRSQARLAEAGLRRAYPGHGEAIDDVGAAIARTLRRHEARGARVLRMLREGPATAHAIAARFFPRLPTRYLVPVMAEVIGVLDWLEAEGEVEVIPEEGTICYRRPQGPA
jgi:glyoxylase-like metal-dependent hydrolase (beta-lactamase superfamily II)